MLEKITPLVLTFNEAPNLHRTLDKLRWAKEIVLLDSFSTDETLEIARSFPQVRVVQRRFDTFASQCNFGLQQIRTPWVLSLDADYMLTNALISDLASTDPPDDVSGYQASFTYCVHGRPLRASLYPPRTVCYRVNRATYHDEGHGHRVRIDGRVLSLPGRILHDDRKPLSRWFNSQDEYAQQEANYLLDAAWSGLRLQDKVRKTMIGGPLVTLPYCLFVRGLVFDGWHGWFYTMQRVLAELLLSIRLLEARLLGSEQKDDPV